MCKLVTCDGRSASTATSPFSRKSMMLFRSRPLTVPTSKLSRATVRHINADDVAVRPLVRRPDNA